MTDPRIASSADWRPLMIGLDNDKQVDLELCAKEPVQTIGHIQPHGLLFALSEPDLVVRQVSANVSDLLGMSPEMVLDRSIDAVLGSPQFERLRSRAASDEPLSASPIPVVIGSSQLKMNCVLHRQDEVLFVELELIEGAQSVEPVNLEDHIRLPISRIEKASNILELSRLAVAEVRRLSGFDRVMVYRFDAEWNGEVIAEELDRRVDSYLGLRFPAGDIPPPVRKLFVVNPMRTISDRDATPVSIVPQIGPLTGRPLDLTRSVLRSAAPIHIEYLRNMGVQASMTMSIIVKDQLWGMIACHHISPRQVDASIRSICLLIGQVVGSLVGVLMDNTALQLRVTARKRLEEHMAANEVYEPAAEQRQGRLAQVRSLLDADGIVASVDGAVTGHGVTLEEGLLAPIIQQLKALSTRGIASSDHLSALDPSAAPYAPLAAGALYIGLTSDGDTHDPATGQVSLDSGTGDYLLLLRRELAQTVRWAGNPNKTATSGDGGRLQPRTSFAAWQETVRGKCRPWSGIEREDAGILREHILRLRATSELRTSEKRARYMAAHDSLTGLINRRSIHNALDHCVKEAESRQSCFSVLFVDLDRFKHFNDTLGHDVGDLILKIVSKRLTHQVRNQDFVGRFGGDEFILILPGLQLEAEVLQVVARILRAIEEPLEIGQDRSLNITASVGLSRYPVDGASSEMLISRSDTAMYRVKRSGGNAFEVYQSDDTDKSSFDRANVEPRTPDQKMLMKTA
jgi:diguanylate cyclase (GGDEF)-like protein